MKRGFVKIEDIKVILKKINSRKEVIYGKETGNIITAKIWKKY